MTTISAPAPFACCDRCDAPEGGWIHRHRIATGEWRPSADPFAVAAPEGFRRAEKVALAVAGGEHLCGHCRAENGR